MALRMAALPTSTPFTHSSTPSSAQVDMTVLYVTGIHRHHVLVREILDLGTVIAVACPGQRREHQPQHGHSRLVHRNSSCTQVATSVTAFSSRSSGNSFGIGAFGFLMYSMVAARSRRAFRLPSL